MRPILFLLILGRLSSPFEVTRSVDRTSVTLGEPLIFRITAVKKADEKLIFPGADASFGEFELKDMRSFEEKDGERVKEGREYKLAVFKLGKAVIPVQRVINAADTSDRRLTDSIEIIIKKVTVADTSDIVDIHGQESIGYGPPFYLALLAVILILALSAYLFDRFILKRRRAAVKPPEVILPPEVRFEKDLNALLLERLLEKGLVKEFHLRISEILRKYLGGRFSFYALESTTTELLSSLKGRNMEGPVFRMVEKFCDLNDPVKFAKWIPSTDESEKLIEISREIVKNTLPRQAAAPAPAATSR